MGIEYSLRFSSPSMEATTSVLLRVPGATGDGRIVDFRSADARPQGMPDAHAQVEDYGLYFCDNGGNGASVFGHVVALLTSAFGTLEIEEL
jgi:hypothetical protein